MAPNQSLHISKTDKGESPDISTFEEKQLATKLRPMVEDILNKDFMKTDEYLIRFLRVHNYNIKKAKQAIETTMKWRKENNMDTALMEDFSMIENEFPGVLDGVDKYGRPVLIVDAAPIDFRKIVKSGQLQKYVRLFIVMLEVAEFYVLELQRRTGNKNISRAIFICDLAGFSLKQHACVQCLPYIPQLFMAYQCYYPDLYRTYIINAPKIFLPLFELVRPLMSETTKKAVKLFDHNSDKWKRALLDEIPADQLPILYGGSRTVVTRTIGEQKQTNPYLQAVFEKAQEDRRKSEYFGTDCN